MSENRRKKSKQRRILRFLKPYALLICLTAVLLGSFSVFADSPEAASEQSREADQVTDTGKTVRVGWYESKFHHMDKYGRRSGYGYEFQRKVSAYT